MPYNIDGWESATRDLVKLIGPLTSGALPADARRRSLIKGLAKLLGSDFTFWAWGRGHPQRGPVVPVAVIFVGASASLQRGWSAIALSPEMDREIRAPIAPLARPQRTTLRSDLFSDRQWMQSASRPLVLQFMRMDEWLHSVRYCGPDTWSTFWFARRISKPPFTPRDREIVDLVLRHVALFHPVETDGDLPAHAMSDLTHRQRTVLLSVLDGQSRKIIADSLKISEHTVNEHIKALFRHFKVHSATELAAKFLRSR
jgi:DNA-binding CsgD family transcriptional regulator